MDETKPPVRDQGARVPCVIGRAHQREFLDAVRWLAMSPQDVQDLFDDEAITGRLTALGLDVEAPSYLVQRIQDSAAGAEPFGAKFERPPGRGIMAKAAKIFTGWASVIRRSEMAAH